MHLRRLNILNWPIRTKLLMGFIFAVLLPLLIAMIPSATQRSRNLRQENKVYLETLGPYEMTRTEQYTQVVIAEVNRQLTNVNDYEAIQDYLLKAPTSMSEQERASEQAKVIIPAARYMRLTPSITRIQFVDAYGDVHYDTDENEDSTPTPGLVLIQTDALGFRNTVSDIYIGSNDTPSIDVIYTFRQAQSVSGVNMTPIGHIIFTQNLTASTTLLPNFYETLANVPESRFGASIFLVNTSGQLVSTSPSMPFLYDIQESPAFQNTLDGVGGTSIYHSPLLNTEVQGYAAPFRITDGPELIFIIETPMEEINEQAFSETVSTLLPIAFFGLLVGLILAFVATTLISRPITRLTQATRDLSAGRSNVQLERLNRRDEIGILTNTFADMADQLLNAIGSLEQRVGERTRNLETTLEIGRVLTSIRDLDTLLEEVVNLIHDRFERIYHVQVFLIDPRSGQARLRASTGAVGRQLLQRGHYLDVGSQSVIGNVTASGHAVLALDTSNNPIHKRNEFLPDTRAEMALPLRIEERVVGALDLQSKEPDAFSEQDVELFQGMADQITIAIESAMLFAETNTRAQEIEKLNRMLSHTAWVEATQRYGTSGTTASAGRGGTRTETWSSLQLEAIKTKQITEQIEGDIVTFAVPVILRGEILGAVEWQVPKNRYTNNTRQTAMELTHQLALTADNVRLFEQSRRTAQRELVVNQISSKLTGSTNIDEILQTAVRELGLVLNSPQTAIQLISPDNGS
jgi:GAF domain-containing protein